MTLWACIGWVGNGCFFARALIQWWNAERTGSDQAPRIFWVLSLAGSVLVGAYAAQRGLAVLVAGFLTNGFIYARNIHLQRRPKNVANLDTNAAAIFAALAFPVLIAASIAEYSSKEGSVGFWLAVAVFGQALWNSRFIVQWWYSERRGLSHFPVVFWVLSLAGNTVLLAYAFHLADAVLIAGLLPGPLMQLRNLAIIRGRGAVGSVAQPVLTTSRAVR